MPSNFQVPNLDYIRQKDARLAEALQGFQDAINAIADQTASVPQGQAQAPPPPSALNVTASGGIFDIAITDNNPNTRGIAPDYFLEYSTTQSFAQPVVIHLGPARNHRVALGNQTFYWRAYSQYGRASNPSIPVYCGGPGGGAQPVIGGGAVTGPNPQASQGSGTGPTNGLQGGSGYGKLLVRIPTSARTQ